MAVDEIESEMETAMREEEQYQRELNERVRAIETFLVQKALYDMETARKEQEEQYRRELAKREEVMQQTMDCLDIDANIKMLNEGIAAFHSYGHAQFHSLRFRKRMLLVFHPDKRVKLNDSDAMKEHARLMLQRINDPATWRAR